MSDIHERYTELYRLLRGNTYASDERLAILREYHFKHNFPSNPAAAWREYISSAYSIHPDTTIFDLTEFLVYAAPESYQPLLAYLHEAAECIRNGEHPEQASRLLAAIRQKEDELTRPRTAGEKALLAEVKSNAETIRRDAIKAVTQNMPFSAIISNMPNSIDSD